MCKWSGDINHTHEWITNNNNTNWSIVYTIRCLEDNKKHPFRWKCVCVFFLLLLLILAPCLSKRERVLTFISIRFFLLLLLHNSHIRADHSGQNVSQTKRNETRPFKRPPKLKHKLNYCVTVGVFFAYACRMSAINNVWTPYNTKSGSSSSNVSYFLCSTIIIFLRCFFFVVVVVARFESENLYVYSRQIRSMARFDCWRQRWWQRQWRRS